MKLLAAVVALAAARKDSCTNVPPVGTPIPGMGGYLVTSDDVASWSACGPNADCTKIRGWNFSCACKAGFIDYDADDYRKNSCYDSCFTAEYPDNSTCDVDSEGNAFWTCNDGYYQATVDVEGSTEATEEVCFFDSCATDPCAENADCAADGDNHVCSCSAGFFDFNGDASLCVPDNCAAGTGGCDADATCSVNMPDSDGNGQNSCTCDDGFYGNGEECFVDSCALNPCQDDSTCANVGDVYTCTCNAGFYLGFAPYEGSGEGSTWTDPAACHVDVCASANPCDVDAACTNNDDGSQSCECNDGFYGDGYECFFDSCATNPCQADSTCANDGDDFSCTCNVGFYHGTNTIEGSTGDFRDEDACHVDVCASADPCDGDAACSNNVDGSQSCACNDGFYGDGYECFVDSCALSPCQADSTCANEGDAFSCTCNAGFYLGHNTVEGSTGDVRDEIACHADVCASASPCDANASCTNNADGSQSCECNFDFKGDGYTCTDIGSLNKAELDSQLAAFSAEAAGITDPKVAKKFDKAMKKFPMGHVDNYVAECMNKREVRDLVAEFEASDIAGAEDELLGWDLSDACSYAKDLATANKRFLKRWACVSQWNFNADAKDLTKENKNLNKKFKKVEKKIAQFKKKVDKELSC